MAVYESEFYFEGETPYFHKFSTKKQKARVKAKNVCSFPDSSVLISIVHSTWYQLRYFIL